MRAVLLALLAICPLVAVEAPAPAPASPFSIDQWEKAHEPQEQAADKSYKSLFGRMVLLLLVMILVLVIIVYFAKRVNLGRLQKGNAAGTIQILERRALSPKAALYIIQVGGVHILVAESGHGVQLLHTLPHKEST